MEALSPLVEQEALLHLEDPVSRVSESSPSQSRPWLFRAGLVTLLVVTACASTYAAPPRQRNEALGLLQQKLSGLTRLMVKKEDLWCQNIGNQPPITAAASGPPMRLKVLTYNLFWWNLFKKRGGNGQSAGRLIAASHKEAPFDLMGFQECEDGPRVLADAGLDTVFHIFHDNFTKCVAFRKEVFTLESAGDADVAADNWWNNYGRRSLQWVRLKHSSGNHVMFANHHGPLSINSGGICGGQATGQQMLGVIGRNYMQGDAVVLVGDFNSNAASLTIQEIRKRLVHVFNGKVWGGIDNIFANTPASNTVKNMVLGSGGSDHDALASIIDFGPSQEVQAKLVAGAGTAAITSLGGENDHWDDSWCGLTENNVQYTLPVSMAWSKKVSQISNPDRCCQLCQSDPDCASWVWIGGALPGARDCALYGTGPVGKSEMLEVASGLSIRLAKVQAAAAPYLNSM